MNTSILLKALGSISEPISLKIKSLIINWKNKDGNFHLTSTKDIKTDGKMHKLKEQESLKKSSLAEKVPNILQSN